MPEVNILEIRGKYRPMYRMTPDENWRLIRRGTKPVECDTASEAKKVADEVVQLVEDISRPAVLIDEPRDFGVEEFLRRRAQEQSSAPLRVFGSAPTSRAFVDGQYVRSTAPQVEVKRRRLG